MTAHRDPDRLIRMFLSEGQTDLPDRAFDAVRRDIHRTRQRVVVGPWREPDMSTLARVAIAAAAVVVLGVAWVNLGPRQGVGTSPTPTPSPSASPSASAQPSSIAAASAFPLLPSNDTPIPAGTYRLGFGDASETARIIATVGAGWTSGDGALMFLRSARPDGVAFGAWPVNGTVIDPCTNHTAKEPTPPAGVEGIDELAAQLATQKGTRGTATAVTIDGYSGTLVEITVASDVDISKCKLEEGEGRFYIWGSGGEGSRYVQGNEETNRVWIMNVNGTRYTFMARVPKGMTAAELAELDAVVRSIDLQPVT
jgi:hypothetical protein